MPSRFQGLVPVVALLLFAGVTACLAGDPKPQPMSAGASAARSGPPAWASDATWYQVRISHFHNGDKTNDPADVSPWPTKPTAEDLQWERGGGGGNGQGGGFRSSYGGDLQGLAARLGYLKNLGFNTLLLSPLFVVNGEGDHAFNDLRHVDDVYGVKGGLVTIVGETDDPTTWKFSQSDRVFLQFVEKAHKDGFRVVLDAPFGKVGAEKPIADVIRRWMDPNGDGNPSDGVDGWRIVKKITWQLKFAERFRARVKRINPDAIVVGVVSYAQTAGANKRLNGAFDVVIDDTFGLLVGRFFHERNATYKPSEFLADLEALRKGQEHTVVVATPRALSLSPPKMRQASSPEAKTAWSRLAVGFMHFYPGAPLAYYGDEVGMIGGTPPYRSAMWWGDIMGSQTPSAYRRDLASLVQLLHIRREVDAPLRTGTYRTVLIDEANKTFAFARTLPGHEVVFVMNYGQAKQRVTLRVGQPGQMIGMYTPQLVPSGRKLPGQKKPPPPTGNDVTPLRIGANRQQVNPKGEVPLWVKPMSFRVVVIRGS